MRKRGTVTRRQHQIEQGVIVDLGRESIVVVLQVQYQHEIRFPSLGAVDGAEFDATLYYALATSVSSEGKHGDRAIVIVQATISLGPATNVFQRSSDAQLLRLFRDYRDALVGRRAP